MSHFLVRDSVVYSAGTLLTRALGFLLIPLYTRFFTVSEYGALSILVLLLQGISFICLLGIGSAAVRLYFSAGTDDASRREVYGTATLLVLTLPVLVLLCVTPLLWRLVTSQLPSIPFYPYVVMVLLIGLFTPGIDLMSGLLTARRRPGTYVAFHLGYFSLQTLAIILAVAGLGYGLKGQVFSQLLTSAIFGSIAIVVLIRYARPHFSRSTARQLLYFGLPLVPFFVASWIDTGAGRFALERFIDLRQVGIFALASQFAGLLTLISTSLDQAMLPHFLSRATDSDASSTLGTLIVRYLSLFGIIAIGISILATPVIVVATTPAFFEAARYVGPLLLANLLYVARTPIMWSLSHSHRTGILSAVNLVSTAVLVTLLIFFLGYLNLGIVSVAYAMIGANLTALVLGTLAAQHSFRILLPWGTLAHATGTLVAGTLLILVLTSPEPDPLRLGAQLAVLLAIAWYLWRILAVGNLLKVLDLRKS